MTLRITSLLIATFFCVLWLSAQEQHQCGTPVPDDATMIEYLKDIKKVDKTIINRSDERIKIPITFTVLSNNNNPSSIDQELINKALQRINEAFEPVGFDFFQIGNIKFIDHQIVAKLEVSYREFSYVSTALNVVIGGGKSNGLLGSANMPNGLPASRNYSNTMWIKGSEELLSATFIHELGHSFGLFHTFEGARLYDNPIEPLEGVPPHIKRHQDHPARESTNFFKRELVIREDVQVGIKPFYQSNADIGGDFVMDTPASCATIAKQDFPDWSDPECRSYKTMGSCYNGCLYDPEECIYIGNYIDYNGDTLTNTKIMIDNFMSYTGKCRQSFTNGQYQRMAFYYKAYRKRQYDATARINWADQIEIEDSHFGLKNVLIKAAHQLANGKHTHLTSNHSGSFESILYEPTTVIEDMTKLGDYSLFEYTAEEWKEGLDIGDIIAVLNHIYGYEKLNGYRQLAADMDADGNITLDDALIIRDLIIGKSEPLTAYDSPWQFVPEFLAQGQSKAFHENPYEAAKTIGLSSPLVQKGTILNIPDGLNGQSGFDAIKLGDLNGSMIKKDQQTEVTLSLRSADFENEHLWEQILQQHSIEEIAAHLATGNQDLTTLIKTISAYPNPTAGQFAVSFSANTTDNGQITITDAFGKVLSQKPYLFQQGINEINIKGHQFPAGIIHVQIHLNQQYFATSLVKTSL